VVSRLVLGGRVPVLDQEYTIGAFFKAYFMSCCGLLSGKLLAFVDSHITFDMNAPLQGPDDKEQRQIDIVRDQAGEGNKEQEVATPASFAPPMAVGTITFHSQSGDTMSRGGKLTEGITRDRNIAEAPVVIDQAPAAAHAPASGPAPVTVSTVTVGKAQGCVVWGFRVMDLGLGSRD
jgi:hypothetical protein